MCTGAEAVIIGQIAAAGVGAISSIQQGIAAKRAAEINAQNQRIQAQFALDAAEFQASQQRRDAERLLSRQTVLFLKGGVEIEGTPLLVLSQQARESELDAQATLFNGGAQAAFKNNAANLSEIRGTNARNAGFAGAGTTLLTGLSSAAKGANKLPKTSFLSLG